MSALHRAAGRLGGLVGGRVTASRFKTEEEKHEHYVAIGKLGGRPTWQETLEKDRLAQERARKQNGRREYEKESGAQR